MPPSLFIWIAILRAASTRRSSIEHRMRFDSYYRQVPRALIFACVLTSWALSSCASPDEVSYIVTTQSRLVCCRSMNFTVAPFPATMKSTSKGTGVIVTFPTDVLAGDCLNGGESPVVIANHTGEDILIPTSRELEGSRIKLYPWRLHHD